MREELIEQNDLKIVNETVKCKGKYTRVNANNPQERSTIDYCIVMHNTWNQIMKMDIDECQQYKLKGKKATDHNTINVTLKIPIHDMTKKNKLGIREKVNITL